MRHQNSVFHQLTKQLPWALFERAVAEHGSDRRVRRLRTRDQFLALLFGQLSGAASLRALVDGLESHQARAYHVGLRRVSRSTLADANARRPSAVYEDVFAALVHQARPAVRRKLRGATRLIDATRLTLSGASAPWAGVTAGHCAAKLHVVYEPDAHVPLRATVTPHRVNDIVAARDFPIEPGATYVFDRAYYDYSWWARLHGAGCRFVSRLKRHTSIAETARRPVAARGTIRIDRIGHLSPRLKSVGPNPMRAPLREIVVRVDRAKALRLVTNDLDTPAEDIAALYKARWDIELFFKWLKQNLKLRHFIGTSENAVKTQIYVALIAFLIIAQAHKAQTDVATRHAFARLISLNIMLRRPIDQLKTGQNIPPPDARQHALNLSLA